MKITAGIQYGFAIANVVINDKKNGTEYKSASGGKLKSQLRNYAMNSMLQSYPEDYLVIVL
ncbi:MAG TPA: hypothetical protein VF298_06595 [Bacteroidales bacterium]|jgi:hypothetical protein